ncbi:hypothetical protein DL96DRAFT_1595847 [Flagelloscypha sp. PMI_526]|nr:hypothetical protein DL96DRAFT_1595847 [Flagelloscypha sp. PMI_526]
MKRKRAVVSTSEHGSSSNKTDSDSASEKESSEPDYAVKVLLAAKALAPDDEDQWEYLVSWAGYDSDADSWEPQSNLLGCERILSSFWKDTGIDGDYKDYPEGKIVKPSREWIAKQKAYYDRELKADNERKRKKKEAESKDVVPEKGKAKRLPKKKSSSPSSSSSSESEEEPSPRRKSQSLSKTHPVTQVSAAEDHRYYESAAVRRQRLKEEAKARRKASDSSSDDDDDHLPPPQTPMTFGEGTGKRRSQLSGKPLRNSKSSASRPSSSMKTSSKVKATQIPPRSNAVAGPSRPKAISRPSKKPKRLRKDSNSSSDVAIIATTPRPLLEKPKPKPPAPREAIAPDSSFFSEKKKPLPLHIRRARNDNLPPPSSAISAAGNATKRRIAAEIAADEERRRSKTKPIVPAPTEVPAGLHFNKKGKGKEKAPSSGPSSRQRTSTPIQHSSETPQVEQTKYSPQAPSKDQIIQNTFGEPNFVDSLFNDDQVGPAFSEDMVQEDTILEDIVPEDTTVPPPPLAPASARPLKIPCQRIPIQWNGSLELIGTNDETEVVGRILVDDIFIRHPSTLSLGDILTDTKATLLIPSFHDVADLDDFMLACSPVSEFAPISTRSDSNEVSRLARFMRKKGQIALLPYFSNEGDRVGHILVFPTHHPLLAPKLAVPDKVLQSSSDLALALLPWKRSAESLQTSSTIYSATSPLPRNIVHHQYIRNPSRWEKYLTKSNYQLALRCLTFPAELNDFLCRLGDKKEDGGVYVWFGASDWMSTKESEHTGAGIQTLFLFTILEKTRAPVLSNTGDPNLKVIFVHIGAMEHLREFPGLIRLRRDQPEVVFYTYGSRRSVPMERWGVHQVFPFGGVVCLSAFCFVETGAQDLLQLIKLLAEHPLWDCYVLPEVLGAAVREVHGNDDVLEMLEAGSFSFEWVLNLIEKGTLALMRSPPHTRHFTISSNPIHKWEVEQVNVSLKSKRKLLQYALKQYDELVDSAPLQRRERIKIAIENDLLSLQMHPAVNSDRRRFVVLCGFSDDTKKLEGRAELEWTTISEFSIQDLFSQS